MRLPRALFCLITGFVAWQWSAVSADDAAPAPSAPHSSEAPPPPDLPDRNDPADSGEATETGPATESDGDIAPPPPFPAPIYWFSPVPPSPPEPSYEEISEGYPPPAHSLVPPALLTGPVYFAAEMPSPPMTYGVHVRFPYYNYRSSWTYGGPASINHTIVW
jgi:hypothetical protein